MKRGFKALAVLAAVAVAVAGPQVFASCDAFGGFAIFQCSDNAYFTPPPAGAGTVSATFWQLGYGNKTLNSAAGTDGTGTSGPTTFNGNDTGNFLTDVLDARALLGPTVAAGSLCIGNNNWGNFGVDGCCDNFRDTTLPGGTGDDGVLNPLYNVYYYRNDPNIVVASNDWVVDYPMGFMMTESTGHFFAIAVVSTAFRAQGINDHTAGYYNFKEVSNGLANPLVPGANNIVPWQRVPGDRDPADSSTNLVRNTAFADPNDLTHSNRILDLGWNAATIYSDNATRPTTNSTMTSPGAGTADIGALVRYVVETQGIVDPNNPYGSLSPTGWTSVTTVHPPGTSAQITVAPDTCVRLHTFFGREPQVTGSGITKANCRLAKCGDVGYDVASAPACIGGPLVADGKLGDFAASRRQGKVTISFSTQHELTVRGFELYAVGKKGTEKIGTLPCNECTTGNGSKYTFTIDTAKLKGAKSVQVLVVGTGAKFNAAIR